jgi:hypothetical protein
LTGVDPAGLDQLGPLSVTREDIRPTDTRTRGDTYFPGAKRVASPQLGVRESFLRTVNGVAGWFDAQLPSRTPNLKTLGVTYRDASGRHLLSIELNGFPTHFDPYERTDGRRVLRLAANPDPQSVDWR